MQETNTNEPTKAAQPVRWQEIKKYDPIEAGIAVLKKQYGDLKVAGPDDKEGYNKIAEGIQVLTKRRVETEKVRKALKKDALEYGRAVDEKAREITEKLRDIENPLRQEKQRIDAERARLKQQEAEAALLKFSERVTKLIENGMLFDGKVYKTAVLTATPEQIKAATDEQFEALLKRAKDESDAAMAAAEAAEKEKEEELQRLREQVSALKAAQPAQPAELPPPPPPVQPTPPPPVRLGEASEKFKQGVSAIQDGIARSHYMLGFNKCRDAVLSILSSPEKFTRAQLVEKINALQPFNPTQQQQ